MNEADAERPAGRFGAGLALILLTGLVVRLALWAWFDGIPPAVYDEVYLYNALAINLVEHGEFALTPGEPTSNRPPLYPAFVAAVYRVFGVDNFQAVRLAQALINLASVVLVYRIGVEAVSRRVGLWAAAFYCFYPSLLGYNNLLLTECLSTVLLVAFCYAAVIFFRRGPLAYLLMVGLLLGLTALTRSSFWLMPPLLAAYLLWVWQAPIGRRFVGVACLLLAFAVPVAPWAVRCTRLERTLTVVDATGGRNFMLGNYEYTPLYQAWKAIDFDDERSWWAVLVARYPEFRSLTQGQRDKLALREAMQFVRANPGMTARRDVVKFFCFWQLERDLIADARGGFFGDLSKTAVIAVAIAIVGAYAAAVILGIYGLLVPPPDRRIHWFFLLVIGYLCALHTASFGHSRYHMPIMPIVLIYSACAVTRIGAVWRQRTSPAFWLATAGCITLVASWIWLTVVADLGNVEKLY